jgi:hypothetical protein
MAWRREKRAVGAGAETHRHEMTAVDDEDRSYPAHKYACALAAGRSGSP